MPVLEVHLVDGDHDPDDVTLLLREASRRYAEVLGSPQERIRAFATVHARGQVVVGGETGAAPAPYFTAVVLEGRPVEQRHRLLEAVTDVVVEVLRVERGRVRGRVVQVPPDDWAIGGVPASGARRDEIAARASG